MSNPESMDDLKRLYAAAPADEPPAALDAAILAQARARALDDASASSTNVATKRRSWGPPVALAAMVVLSASLVWVMEREQPDRPDVGVIAPPARDIALAPAMPQQPPAPVAESSRAPARMRPERRADTRKVEAAPPAVAPRMIAPHAAPLVVPPAVTPMEAPNREPEQRTEKAAAEIRARSFAVPAPAPAPAAAPAQRPSAGVSIPGSQGSGMGARDAASAQPDAARATERTDETPEAWLRRLAELRQQGRFREFEEGLDAFRKRHPGYRIPEALLAPTDVQR